MLSTISSFWVDETPIPLFTNPNISLFPDEILADNSSSILNQSTTAPHESPSAVKPADSTSVIPSSSFVSPPPQLRRTYCVSQLSVLLWDYVCHSTIVTYEPRTYREASSNPLWQKAMIEEPQALTSTHTWDIWLIYLLTSLWLVASRFIKSRLMQMDL